MKSWEGRKEKKINTEKSGSQDKRGRGGGNPESQKQGERK